MTITVFGLANCDTVRRARAWLAERGIAAEFHDFKKSGVPAERLDAWLRALGWEALLNRKGTTWRRLDDAERNAAVDAASAASLMRAEPSVIKRPVVDWGDGVASVGFDPTAWAARGSAPVVAGSGCQQLPQHEGQDAAVLVVVDLDGGVDPEHERRAA